MNGTASTVGFKELLKNVNKAQCATPVACTSKRMAKTDLQRQGCNDCNLTESASRAHGSEDGGYVSVTTTNCVVKGIQLEHSSTKRYN
jgi:hypothetical protein